MLGFYKRNWFDKLDRGFTLAIHPMCYGFYFYWTFDKKYKDYWFLNVYVLYHKKNTPNFTNYTSFWRRLSFNRQVGKSSTVYRALNKYQKFKTKLEPFVFVLPRSTEIEMGGY